MPRPKNVIPTVQLCLMLPEDIRGWLDLQLFSELEGRVPKGAYQDFFLRLIRQERDWRSLDLSEFGFVPGARVAGAAGVLDELRRRLRAEAEL